MPSTEQRVGWGSIVRARRKALELSQDDLAAAAGVSLKTITNIETGATTPQNNKLQAVLDALGLPGDKAQALHLMASDRQPTTEEEATLVLRESLLGWVEERYGEDPIALRGIIRDLLYSMSIAQVMDVLGPLAQIRAEGRD